MLALLRCTLPCPHALCRCLESTGQQYLSVLQGMTALHVAACESIAVELLGNGADIASRDDKVSPTQLILLKAGLCTAKTRLSLCSVSGVTPSAS